MRSPAAARDAIKEEVLDRIHALVPRFAERAEAAEEARRLPPESVNEMREGGLARILLPERIGGYGLGFDTWFEAMREISKADASHGWIAGLIIHHAHIVAQFSEAAQKAIWADGPDVSIAAAFAPVAKAVPAEGGYRVTGNASPFASGVDHSPWVVVAAMAHDGPKPEWKFFLIKPGDFTVRDTWFTAGMRGTGSKTIVTENVFVPASHVLSLSDLRNASGPGCALTDQVIYHTPFFYYAPITFVAPMLGAVQGAYELFRDWTKTRKAQDGSPMAEKNAVQVRLARTSADIDAADLLIRRGVNITDAPQDYSPMLLARSIRDFTRASELIVTAIDTLVALSGTAGFTSSHPMQRAWRDIHFMSMHISLNVETNFTHFGRMELGLGRDPNGRYF